MSVNCQFCNSAHVRKSGNHNGLQRYQCVDCKKYFDFGEYENNRQFHFGVLIKVSERSKLTRENYCTPTNKCRKSHTEWLKDRVKYDGWRIPNSTYADFEHYSDEWVQAQYEDCMLNYDYNMAYFSKLDFLDFDKTLKNFVSENKFKQIEDLNEVDGTVGFYILVLDEYKQVYIGQALDIKRRILQHWSAKKSFDRLIFGTVETSVLSIDSFGALDTTRIFYKKRTNKNIHEQEEQLVAAFDDQYTLNRIAGGFNGKTLSMQTAVELVNSIKKRELYKE